MKKKTDWQGILVANSAPFLAFAVVGSIVLCFQGMYKDAAWVFVSGTGAWFGLIFCASKIRTQATPRKRRSK